MYTISHLYLCALKAENLRAGKIFGLEVLVIKSVVTQHDDKSLVCSLREVAIEMGNYKLTASSQTMRTKHILINS